MMRIVKRCILLTVAIIATAMIFAPTANAADASFIPKPTLKILVRGIDTRNYTLDLLVQDEKNTINQIISDKHIIAIKELYYYEDEEGYHPALLGGTKRKLYGEMKGYWQGNGEYEHNFWYTGVPENFKIAILNEEGKLIISKIVHRKQYHSTMIFDITDESITESVNYDIGKVKETIPFVRIIMNFLLRVLASLLIMGYVAKLMGFKSKKSRTVIITTKTITQSLINVIFILQINWGMERVVEPYLYAQLAALVVEMIVFAKLLEERTPFKRARYAFLGNLVTTVVGYYLIYLLSWIAF